MQRNFRERNWELKWTNQDLHPHEISRRFGAYLQSERCGRRRTFSLIVLSSTSVLAWTSNQASGLSSEVFSSFSSLVMFGMFLPYICAHEFLDPRNNAFVFYCDSRISFYLCKLIPNFLYESTNASFLPIVSMMS